MKVLDIITHHLNGCGAKPPYKDRFEWAITSHRKKPRIQLIIHGKGLGPLLLTWFHFNPSMDK